MKKILYLIGLTLMIGLSGYLFISFVQDIFTLIENKLFSEYAVTYITVLLQSIFTITVSILCIVKLFKTHISMPLKYTYDEYKQNKLNAKKEKLKKQLEEIEKTE